MDGGERTRVFLWRGKETQETLICVLSSTFNLQHHHTLSIHQHHDLKRSCYTPSPIPSRLSTKCANLNPLRPAKTDQFGQSRLLTIALTTACSTLRCHHRSSARTGQLARISRQAAATDVGSSRCVYRCWSPVFDLASSVADSNQYCSRSCEQENYKNHAAVCNAAIANPAWCPEYERVRRIPTFLQDHHHEDKFEFTAKGFQPKQPPTADRDTPTHLWGMTPEFGSTRIGVELVKSKNLQDLLFAACGDIRDAVTMLNEIRKTHAKPVNVVLNDVNPYVSLRNLLLMMLLGAGEVDAAIEMWYQPVMGKENYKKVVRLVSEDFSTQLDAMPSGRQPGSKTKADSFDVKVELKSGATVFCTLPRGHWDILLEWFTRDTAAVSATKAQTKRELVTRHPHRKDEYERRLYFLRPEWRNSLDKYARDGIVAPFDTDRRKSDNLVMNP